MLHYSKLLNYHPYEYQVKGINFAKEHKYVMIGDSMGLGKTLQALAVAFEQITNYGKKVLVICPSYLKNNWNKEIYKHHATGKLKVQILTKGSDYAELEDVDVYIGSYSLIKHAGPLFQACSIIIADEAHMLKGKDSIRTKTFNHHVETNGPEYLILLSGTPVRNQVYDFYAPLHILSHCKEGTNGVSLHQLYGSYHRFCRNFCYMRVFRVGGGKNRIREFYGLKNVEKLKVLLEGKYIRRLAEDVLELPEILEKEILMNYIDAGAMALQTAWEKFEQTEKMTGHIMRAKKAAAGFKAKHTAKYCEQLIAEGYGPLVIYTDHPEAAERITKELDGLRGAVVTGKTDMNTRHQIVNEFQDGKLKFIVASIKAFSEGINLHKASNLVFNDISWVDAENQQAIKRIHRIGQGKKCIIHYIIGGRTDKIILDVIRKKKAIIKQLEEA